jgi:outer membrane protein assembly factor BamB
MKSHPFVQRPLGLLAAAACALSLAACGGDSDQAADGGGPAGSALPLVSWPYFGRVPERTHYLPAPPGRLDPPLREAWSINTHGLIEFPPAIGKGVAYVVNKFGNVKAVRLSDRTILWTRNRDPSNHGKQTDVTAPVYHRGMVFLAELDGDLIALDADTGKQVWKRDLHAHLESSPIAIGARLYLGDDKTNVVAARVSDGKVLWQFNSPGAIKASPSYHDGRLYVADYQGSMYCLDAGTGKPIWRTNTTKAPPYGSGGFFSSPAIAFGRVYAARDDGTVFAFDLDQGKVTWSFPTGGDVYGSPALAQAPGTPPSVYIGAENGAFYALAADDGKPRWRYEVGGPVPGTATVIGHTAWVSSFKTQKTIGVDVRTGKPEIRLHQAGYTPVVSDGRRLYLIGYFELVGLAPKRP